MDEESGVRTAKFGRNSARGLGAVWGAGLGGRLEERVAINGEDFRRESDLGSGEETNSEGRIRAGDVRLEVAI